MVTTLYIFILVPVVIYLIFSIIEIWITYRIAVHRRAHSLRFIQASTEVTHTLLVFAYAQFMVVFSDLLMRIGAQLWWPIALLMVSILLRGSLYLLLFYRERPQRSLYAVLLATYLIGVASLMWALCIIVPAIVTEQFIPDTTNMAIVYWFGFPALALIMVPLIAVYSYAFKQLKK